MQTFSSTQKPKALKKKSKTDREFKSLRSIVPSLSKKSSVDKLEVVLEAIQYIRQLEEQLCQIDPSLLKAAFVATACSLQK
jgi:superfamily I DNA and RNA helicase